MHAAFTSADISPTLVKQITSQLEETAERIAETSHWDLTLSPSKTLSPSPGTPPNSASQPEEDLITVDQEIVSQICGVASAFLRISRDLVNADTSLLSLGLDSIKSVGLSRRLTAQNLSLTSADIMRLSSPLRLAAYIQRSKAIARQEDCLSDATFAKECETLREALDVDAIKLSANDEVKIFPTSVLQAGMLSQVRVYYVVDTRILTHRPNTDGRISWTPLRSPFPHAPRCERRLAASPRCMVQRGGPLFPGL